MTERHPPKCFLPGAPVSCDNTLWVSGPPFFRPTLCSPPSVGVKCGPRPKRLPVTLPGAYEIHPGTGAPCGNGPRPSLPGQNRRGGPPPTNPPSVRCQDDFAPHGKRRPPRVKTLSPAPAYPAHRSGPPRYRPRYNCCRERPVHPLLEVP